MNTFPQPTARGFLRNKVIEAAKALAHVKSDQRGEAQGDAIMELKRRVKDLEQFEEKNPLPQNPSPIKPLSL